MSKPVWIGIAGGGLALLLLGLILHELSVSRQKIESQEAIARATRSDTEPVLERARSLLESGDELAKPLRRAEDEISLLLEEAPGLVAAAESTALRATRVLSELSGLDLRSAIASVSSIADLAATLSSVDLAGVVQRAGLLLNAVDPARVAAATATGLGRLGTLVQLQRKTLGIQRNSLQVQKRSLRVQKDTRRHVRRLDRRLGGGPP